MNDKKKNVTGAFDVSFQIADISKSPASTALEESSAP